MVRYGRWIEQRSVQVGFVIGTSRDSMSAVTKAPVHIPAQLNEKLQALPAA